MTSKTVLATLGSIFLVLVLAALSFIGACASKEEEQPTGEPIEIVVATDQSELGPDIKGLKMAMSAMEDKTRGKVKFVFYPSGTLLNTEQLWPGVLSGACDIGVIPAFAYPGLFPLTSVMDLPPGFTKAELAVVNWDFFKKNLIDKEWSEVKPLYMHPGPTSDLMINKLVRAPSDLKGLRVFAIGRCIETLAAWGATPVQLPYGEIYGALAKGTIDGVYASAYALEVLKWGEVVDYSIPLGCNTAASVVVMNLDTYNSLPEEIKTLFDEWSDWVPEVIAGFYGSVTEAAYAFLEENGGEIIHLSPDEMAAFRIVVIETVNEKWADDLEAKGLPGRKMLEARYEFLKPHFPEVFR